MARPRLNLTPEERRERIRLQANARKEVQRLKEKELRMTQQVATEMAEIDQLYELAEELLQMKLPAAIEVVAQWQTQTGRPFPALFAWPQGEQESWPDYYARTERARKLLLIRMMAVDHVRCVGQRRRKATFNAKEAKEAAALGMTADAYRKHKKGKKLAAQMAKIVADRAAA